MPARRGLFRISLTYDAPTGAGKTTAHTDTYHGRFVKLVPNEQVVEVVEFETTDPALQGEMTITTTLADADGGTDVVAVHDGLPPGVPPCRQRGRLAGGRSRSSRRSSRRARTRATSLRKILPHFGGPVSIWSFAKRVDLRPCFGRRFGGRAWVPRSGPFVYRSHERKTAWSCASQDVARDLGFLGKLVGS